MLKTKEDLLLYMARNNACEEATAWVEARNGSFSELVNECDMIDWLAWLLAYIRPRAAADVATRCARRLRGEVAEYGAEDFADRAHSLADDGYPPSASVPDALYHARMAAGPEGVIGELAEQLRDLRATILEVA